MFTLELSLYAVLLHEGKLLLSKHDDSGRTCCALPGTSIVLGQPLPASIESMFAAKYQLQAKVVKLLYLVDQAHNRKHEQVHELAHYYVCELVEPGQWAPDADELLVPPAQLLDAGFEPSALVPQIICDAADGFKVSPKHVVIQTDAAGSTSANVTKI